MPDWPRIRTEFPALERWTFLNTATFGQVPRRAVEAVSAHFARRDELACTDFMEWFDDADRIRAAVARLIHCQAADIAFVPNACTGLSLLYGLDWHDGDRVVTLEHEFPNHYYFPAHLRARGVEFVETPYEHFREAITPRTRLVVLSTVNYSTGFRAPLNEMAPFLREHGVLLFVDGTQSAGALRFDVAAAQPDLLAVDGYKWLLAPNGAGFIYVHPTLRARLEPNVVGWRSHKDWRRHEQLHHGAPEFRSEAEKYEGGMLVFPALYGMAASIEWFLEIGLEVIERRVLELAEKTREVLRRAGAQVLSDVLPHHDSPIVCARFEGRDASVLAAELKAKHRVLVAARHGNLRVSPHFYNNEEDLDRLASALRAAFTL